MGKTSNMKLKAIFVDIDNTLLDFDEYVRQTMKDGFIHFGLKAYEPWMYDIFKRENDKLWRKIELAEITFEELQKVRWNIIFELIGIDFDGPTFETYFRKALFDSYIIVDGSVEMLAHLASNYLVCAASNGPSYQQNRRLGLADMTKYFDHIFISEDCGISKPAAGFFDYCFEKINEGRAEEDKIKPEECLIIGDSMTSDMAGGREYGMKTCFYRRNPAQKIEDGSVDWIVDELTEIINIV
ncbi:MAG: HAD family hydrolase [Lachnospiraceae bacterium]|nr:HAD family hydrolase [Lachnospiraceae bacterium]